MKVKKPTKLFANTTIWKKTLPDPQKADWPSPWHSRRLNKCIKRKEGGGYKTGTELRMTTGSLYAHLHRESPPQNSQWRCRDGVKAISLSAAPEYRLLPLHTGIARAQQIKGKRRLEGRDVVHTAQERCGRLNYGFTVWLVNLYILKSKLNFSDKITPNSKDLKNIQQNYL